MKRQILYTALFIPLLMISCTAEYYESPIPGPMGPQGPQGPAGESSYVFEYTEVTFGAPDYEVILEYPASFNGLATDIALVYLLWDVQEINGVSVDVWRPLPQQVYAPFGIIQYNYDFTSQDVRLFMEGTFAPENLSPIDTDNWVVRVVIVPGDFWGGGRVEYPDYEEIIQELGYSEPIIKRNTSYKRR